MRQREFIQNQIDGLEAKLNHVDFYASRNDMNEVRRKVVECKEQLDEIKSSIEREPLSGNELNKR
jgi:hypothetical protein